MQQRYKKKTLDIISKIWKVSLNLFKPFFFSLIMHFSPFTLMNILNVIIIFFLKFYNKYNIWKWWNWNEWEKRWKKRKIGCSRGGGERQCPYFSVLFLHSFYANILPKFQPFFLLPVFIVHSFVHLLTHFRNSLFLILSLSILHSS